MQAQEKGRGSRGLAYVQQLHRLHDWSQTALDTARHSDVTADTVRAQNKSTDELTEKATGESGQQAEVTCMHAKLRDVVCTVSRHSATSLLPNRWQMSSQCMLCSGHDAAADAGSGKQLLSHRPRRLFVTCM